YEEARTESNDVGAGAEALEAEARIAECHLLNGHGQWALAYADDALERARAMGGVATQSPMLRRVRAYALMQLGRLDDAANDLAQSLEDGRSRRAEYEVAL